MVEDAFLDVEAAVEVALQRVAETVAKVSQKLLQRVAETVAEVSQKLLQRVAETVAEVGAGLQGVDGRVAV